MRLVVIEKVSKTDEKNREYITYKLFDLDTYKIHYMTYNELQQYNKNDFVNFRLSNSNNRRVLAKTSFFGKIVISESKDGQDINKYPTLLNINKDKLQFIVLDIDDSIRKMSLAEYNKLRGKTPIINEIKARISGTKSSVYLDTTIFNSRDTDDKLLIISDTDKVVLVDRKLAIEYFTSALQGDSKELLLTGMEAKQIEEKQKQIDETRRKEEEAKQAADEQRLKAEAEIKARAEKIRQKEEEEKRLAAEKIRIEAERKQREADKAALQARMDAARKKWEQKQAEIAKAEQVESTNDSEYISTEMLSAMLENNDTPKIDKDAHKNEQNADVKLNYKEIIWNMYPMDTITVPYSSFKEFKYKITEVLESNSDGRVTIAIGNIYKERRDRHTIVMFKPDRNKKLVTIQVLGQSDIAEKALPCDLKVITKSYGVWLRNTKYIK